MNINEALAEAKRKLELHTSIEKSEPSVIEYDELVVKALEKQIQAEADGCVGCEYIYKGEYEQPCLSCKRSKEDLWTEKGVMNKEKHTLHQICRMIASGEIPKKVYNKYLSNEPIGLMTPLEMMNYLLQD